MTCLIIMLPFGGCVRKKQVTAQKAGVLKPEAPGKEVLDHGEAVVDISNVAQGYVALRYKGSAKKISVEVIGKNNKVYKYFIERTKEPAYFPLTSGNGTYQISVYENVQDDEYSVLMMEKGLQKGLQEGLQEGLQKGKESTARNMKAEGITPLIIQKCTGLSLEEIERL